MPTSIVNRAAFTALSLGLRMPRGERVQAFDQQGRTIDAVARHRIDVVLDVGANRGHWSRHLRMMGYKGLILAFEPDPETFEHLRAAAAGDDGWRVFNCALGSEPGEIDFHVVHSGEETVLSSALKPLNGEGVTTRRVPVRTVAEVLAAEKVPADARKFLKMDTQGFDLEVFRGAAGADGIRLLQSEVSIIPLYEGMPHYTESLLAYEAGGFELLDLFVVRRTGAGSVLEYDALMARGD